MAEAGKHGVLGELGERHGRDSGAAPRRKTGRWRWWGSGTGTRAGTVDRR